MTRELAGMYAALMTGLSDAGEFDPQRQRNINDYVLRQGLAGLYVGGSSGESGLLTVDELLAQQEVVFAGAAGSGVNLIAHVGMPNLRESIRLARHAKKLGYHALSALPPHSYPFSDEEVYGYYQALAAATDLPLIVYEIPLRTGRPLPLALLVRLLDLGNVVGIKYTSTDLFKYSLLRKRQPQKLFFYGFDEIYAAAGMLGTEGGIGTTYNLLGRLYVAVDQAVRAGDLARAKDIADGVAGFRRSAAGNRRAAGNESGLPRHRRRLRPDPRADGASRHRRRGSDARRSRPPGDQGVAGVTGSLTRPSAGTSNDRSSNPAG